MKKNRMLRLAYSLLVAVVLSTCVISGTFAKYVTTNNAEDEARVAKFGVAVSGSGEMFSVAYVKDDDSYTTGGVTVKSTENVVAPGTSGKLGGFTVNGTPEVAVRVSYEGEVELGENWEVTIDAITYYHCPLKVTVNDKTLNGNDYKNADEFEEAIETAINSYSQDYAPGTNLFTKFDTESLGDDDLNVYWAWDFETSDPTNPEVARAANKKDTLLGDQAAANNAATISVDVTCTVTQID